jgi:tRNA threonylcarbamoyl adenosine modification protein YeaZ
MILLALDCSARLCAAAVHDGARELGRAVRDLGTGHAEHLVEVVEEALAKDGLSFPALERIGVAVGPGSFTGLRVGVAAARGYALALKIPAVGVTNLEALAAEARAAFPGRAVLAALDAGIGIHAALYDEAGGVTRAPAALTLEEAAALARLERPVLAGSAAQLIATAAGHPFDFGPTGATADIGTYARLAAQKPAGGKPAPLYLRAPDAKPQAGFAVARKPA